MKKKNRMPWVSLIVIAEYLFMLVMLVFTTVKSLTAYALAFIVLQNSDIGAKFIGDFPVMLSLALLEVIILTFILAGIFYSSRWMMLSVFAIQVVLIINTLIRLIKFLVIFDFKLVLAQFVGILILLVLLWAIMKSLQSYYYGGNGKPFNWKTWQGWKQFLLGEKNSSNSSDMTTF